jgi:hypothetical protein
MLMEEFLTALTSPAIGRWWATTAIHLITVALMLNLGLASVYAQQNPGDGSAESLPRNDLIRIVQQETENPVRLFLKPDQAAALP